MPKKLNAYGLFVKAEHERRAKANIISSMQRLYAEMDGPWKTAPLEVKEYYKQLAKGNRLPKPSCLIKDEGDGEKNDMNELAQLAGPESSSSCALSIQNRVNIKTEKKKTPVPNHSKLVSSKHSYEEAEFYRLHNNCRSLVTSKSHDDLLNKPMFSFSVNVLCDHINNDGNKKFEVYYPLEIGIVAHSIKEGRILDPYHVMIDCGDLPNGKLAAAVEHQEFHKIPFRPKNPRFAPESRNDYKKIYEEICDYVKPSERTILVWTADFLDQVKGSLEWLYWQATKDGVNLREDGRPFNKVSHWTILPVAEYISAIEEHLTTDLSEEAAPLFSIYYVELKLEENEDNNYNEVYQCQFHRQQEYDTKWCALSRAHRVFTCLAGGFQYLWELWEKYQKEQEAKLNPCIKICEAATAQITNGVQEIITPIRGGEQRRLNPNEIASAGVVYEEPPDVF